MNRRSFLRALASIPFVGSALARRVDPMPKAETCWAPPMRSVNILNLGPEVLTLVGESPDSEPRNRFEYKVGDLRGGEVKQYTHDGKRWIEIT